MSSDPNASDSVVDPKDRILLVDDDGNIRRLLRRLLERAGYDVLEAADGQEAIEVTEHSFVNLVITDMLMPRKTGRELLAHMNQRLPFVPVIIITAKPVVEAAVECMRDGAYDYISKPFDFTNIRECVERALQEHHELLSRKSTGMLYNINHKRFFGEYRINGVLGEGSAGIVFKAVRQDDEHYYALKILKPNHVGQYSLGNDTERFLRTAEAIAGIKHPNLANVIEYGLTGSERIPFVVMEFFEARTLRHWLDDPAIRWSLADKLLVLRQVAAALEAIHGLGISHRDVKPQNIMVDASLAVKLTDFGIARLPNSELTLTDEIVGSPAYLSPEGFDSAHVDHRADLFSLGVLGYELLMGKKPFNAKSIPQFADMVRNMQPVAPREIDPDFPPVLEEMLAQLLRKSPERRMQSAARAMQMIDSFLNGQAPVDDETVDCMRSDDVDWA